MTHALYMGVFYVVHGVKEEDSHKPNLFSAGVLSNLTFNAILSFSNFQVMCSVLTPHVSQVSKIDIEFFIDGF